MDGVTFRVASVADVDSISVAATHVFLDTYAIEGLRPLLAREALAVYSVAAFAARLNDAATTILLAERGEFLLGFAEFTREQRCPVADCPFDVELVRLYLLPVAQGQGLGQALLRRAEAMLAAERRSGMWLAAWSGNQRALAFYPKAGYEDVGRTDYVIEGQAFDNRVFARAVRAAP